MNGNATEVLTVCGACTNSCSLKVKLKDGKVDKVEGYAKDPRTKGAICSKGLSAKQMLQDPRRLKYPVKRAGERGENKWERISWEEALKTIAEAFNKVKAEHGPRAVGFYNGQASGWGFPYQMYERMAHAFGADVSWGTSECFVPRVIGQAMTYAGVPMFPDYEKANMIVYWGRQPAFSSSTQSHFALDARDRGCKIVAIDPLHFHMAAKADRYLRIEPGTDLALALAVLYVIVEKDLWDHEFVDNYTNDPGLSKLREHLWGGNSDQIVYTPEWAAEVTGIPAKEIRSFAEELATTKGVCIITGHGLEGRINVTQTARAIAILRLVTGNFDAPGGDVVTTMSPKLNAEFTLNHMVNPDEPPREFVEFFNVPQYNPPECHYPLLYAMQGCMPTPDAMDLVENGTVKAGIIQACNPLLMFPNAAKVKEILSKLEFVAVVDPYITETSIQLADIVLPAAMFLEKTEPEYFQYDRFSPYIRLRKQVATFEEALPDWLICVKLANALGLGEYFPSEDIAYYTDLMLKPSGITYEQLSKEFWVWFGEIEYRKYQKSGFALPGGKANIFSEVFAQIGYDPLPRFVEGAENRRSTPDVAKEYPFICFTGRPGPMYVHDQGRTLPWIREMRPEALAMVNTLDAEKQGIQDGDMIELTSLRGKMKIKAHVTNIVSEGSVYVPGGWPDANYNELSIDDKFCPISSQANYTSCLAQMTKTEKEALS
ncbi:MAG: molybdopterin-dependent oxidoreductase [Clostridiales bacterium]|nr:molybdopterin-dependent oxidoreductase [Clostridiales bacterium]